MYKKERFLYDKRFYMIVIGLVLLVTLIIFGVKNSGNGNEDSSTDDFTLNNSNSEDNGSYGVSSDSSIATEVGMKIIEQGGNAVDAAIAVSFVLGVAEPYGSGIGGGGTMLIHPNNNQDPVVYDYRETAPDNSLSSSGIGVPGFINGMYRVHEDFGTMDMEQLIGPSINFAANGVTVTDTLHNALKDDENRLSDLDHLFPDGEPIKEGELLVQEQLAETLEDIQRDGPSAFYQGDIGNEINEKEEDIQEEDLETYKTEVKDPIQGKFGGFAVLAPPPPSGGVMLIQVLEMAEALNIQETKDQPLAFSLKMGLINRISYGDRLENVGDPNFTDMPMEELISEDHIDNLSSEFQGLELSKEYLRELESDADIDNHKNTTHFVIVDRNGMMVSVTNTLSDLFGSGEYVDGFFLNNQLKNFSNKEDSPNLPESGKRPFSYTSPTILTKDDSPVIGIGSAGGRKITSMIAQQLVKTIKFNEPIQAAVNNPRTFLEFNEDVLQVEQDSIFLKNPEDLGFDVQYVDDTSYHGSVQGLIIDEENEKIHGFSDNNREGTWMSK
ncbi:gamma-glutamyltransferase [Oceanobacillus kimchii]|uniref:gamma-glutamyltransferase n=1 Tax=Oceanobacillus kimchii TaxID=746691 RepID=UPI0021A6A18B|nr:gamma-glutamyltransferase [Oceanobacillus kimchii]MCT1577896.1 gamma-glutamyltransferase [Oceanobacillus kimchii]MCT2136884.1 gamma-glutamyltransferase [Oceanobacillus kimchii]